MSQKGKSKKAEPVEDLALGLDAEDPSTLAGRIGASASSLLQNCLTKQKPGAVTGTLASLTADTAKGGSSTLTGTGEGSSSQLGSYRGDDASNQSLTGESFRSREGRGGVSACYSQAAFDEFATNPQALQPDLDVTQQPPASGGSLPVQSVATADHESNVFFEVEEYAWKFLTRQEGTFVSSNDGAAVVALLSDPAFNVDEEPTISWPVVVTGKHQDKLKSPKSGQQAQNKPVNLQAPVTTLDLVPNLKPLWDTTYASDKFSSAASYEGRNYLEPANGDIQPWLDILDKYHDEVWGDMLPLVQEARKEAQLAVKSPEAALQNRPALRRLAMLLKHLDQPV